VPETFLHAIARGPGVEGFASEHFAELVEVKPGAGDRFKGSGGSNVAELICEQKRNGQSP
jgi:hypothetical protein